MRASPGLRFREAVEAEQPLQLPGVINAYCAMLAASAGFRALYVSGAGVANASFGVPDLGITTLNDVVEDVSRITSAVELPVLVDADTGFGSAFQIARTIKQLTRAGAAGVHIEDQVSAKRCGHRPNKAIVSQDEMVDRIRAAVDAREDENFVIMARTDAIAVEGLEAAIQRAQACVEAGADMIFPEAVDRLEVYQIFAEAVKVPVLANLTEFGKTPLFTLEELRTAGVGLALYPLSAFRAMSAAALHVFQTIRQDGTQQRAVQQMQTRSELYDHLNYLEFEQRLDRLFGAERGEPNG
ncbi:methylisocitrate lyase [Paenibacillus cellulosilyticus]|uniref:2-methylisocitrate lyase n=1 Tax=Paenibacillus cellulosilyticus TaxID=375489 RepID=A0A2V2YM03_9BACL|nr:methylisocitrate lyase [Paenibacillus cellulosilyticus]PWV95231.1 methylisocitrate lyase [Paenibacillus cellulosilyticus]QKS46022.1 methylisocitrate lyase [Paenibacillus cellulosilyticus]